MLAYELFVINWQEFLKLNLNKTDFLRAVVRYSWRSVAGFYLQDYFFSELPTAESDGYIKVTVNGKAQRYYYQTI